MHFRAPFPKEIPNKKKKKNQKKNYPSRLVNREFERALEIGKADILNPKSKETKRDVFPLVIDYNPRLPKGQKLLRTMLIYYISSLLLEGSFHLNSSSQLPQEARI